MKIDHVYVINLKHRKDRWEQVNNNFKDVNFKLQRWEAINGKELDEKTINLITSEFCNNFCTLGIIGCWLSHYTLWHHIVKNQLNNVLILEDDAIPTDIFNLKINKILNEIPENYDICYLGCDGSCDNKNNILMEWYFGKNKDLYINESFKSNELMIPSVPLSLQGYLISYKGAKKLLNHPAFKHIDQPVDLQLASQVYNKDDGDFNMYATIEPLIVQNTNNNISDLVDNNHPAINYFLSKISVGNSCHNLDYILGFKLIHIRKLNITITGFHVLFAIISFLIGYLGNNEIVEYYISFIIILFTIESLMKKNINIPNTIIEILTIILFLYLGIQLR